MNFHKSYVNRMLLGVCGGLGETFGVNPNYIRAGFILLNLVTRLPVFLIYLALGFFLPYGDGQNGPQNPFGGFSGGTQDTEESTSGTPGKDYRPEAPPFDVSGATDVDYNNHENDGE